MSEFKLIAATGCPTGIAHTFMAQEALEQAAKEKGVSIKVETHGQVGVENELTPAEIAGAKAVIIAADKDVQAERFAGKRVIEVSVADGIKKADQLIADALAGKGQIKGGTKIESAELSSDTEGESFGRQVYRHLMNGVSHMLPFVVAGGVLVAISFLFGIYSFDPKSEQYNWFAALLKTDIGGVAMGVMTPILAAYIAESIAKRPGFVAGFVGGMMAVNGGSGFLGGIIAGFAAGYIVLGLMKLFEKLPKSLDGLKAIFLYPVFGVFLTGMVMAVVNSPMAWVNKSLMAWLGAFEMLIHWFLVLLLAACVHLTWVVLLIKRLMLRVRPYLHKEIQPLWLVYQQHALHLHSLLLLRPLLLENIMMKMIVMLVWQILF